MLIGQTAHYLGPIITTADEPRNFEDDNGDFSRAYFIEDGQQRITAITVFIHALANRLEVLAAELEDAETKLDMQVTVRELRALTSYRENGEEKLRLVNETPLFNEYLQYKLLPGAIEPRGRTVSMRCLDEVYNYYEDFCSALDDTISVTQWANKLTNRAKLIFVDLASDNIDRYLAFDAINSRGLPLTDFDKIKNFAILLAQRKPTLAYQADEEWRKALQRLEHYGASDRKYESAFIAEAFSVFFSDRTGRDQVHEKFSEFSTHLLEGDDQEKERKISDFVEFWDDYSEAFGFIFCTTRKAKNQGKCSTEAHKWITFIDQMGLPTIARPILCAGLLKFSRNDFEELCEVCEIYVFRTYALRGRRTDANKIAINTVAHGILLDGLELEQVKSIICQWLEELAPFEQGLSFLCDGGAKYYYDKTYKGWSHCYYFLYQYELSLQGANANTDPPNWHTNPEQQKGSIEHILPQKHRDRGWWESSWTDENLADKYKHRLGNLVLTNGNSALDRKPIAEKISDSESYCYESNEATLSEREITSHTDGTQWLERNILDRERSLIAFASERWTFGCCADECVVELPAEHQEHSTDSSPITVSSENCTPAPGVDDQVESEDAPVVATDDEYFEEDNENQIEVATGLTEEDNEQI